MSDNEYYSNSDSENSDKEDSDNEEIPISSNKKPLFNPSINIKKNTDDKDSDVDDSEPDDAGSEEEDEEEEDDVQVGGVEDFIDEDDYVKNDDEEDSDIELNEDGEPIEKVAVIASKNNKSKKPQMIVEEDDYDEDDDYDENYLQKFDNEIIKNYVNEFHPECLNHNYDEITKLSIITRNPDGIIIDPLHRTIPYLTKYEKARVLGQRAKQIETGAKPLVKVPENIVDSYIIAELELREKKIPFIIRRPIPGGGCEYWNLKDLEQIAF